MKYTLIKTVAIYLLTAFPLLADAATQKVSIKQSVLDWRRHCQVYPRRF